MDVTNIVWTLVATFAVICLASVFTQGALLRRLKVHHPAVFGSLGCPKLIRFAPRESGGPLELWQFVRTREHRLLDDPKLGLLSDAYLASVYLACALLIAIVSLHLGGRLLGGAA